MGHNGRQAVRVVMPVDAADERPFLLSEYLTVVSALDVLAPETITVACAQLPYGLYWSMIRESVTLTTASTDEATEATHIRIQPHSLWVQLMGSPVQIQPDVAPLRVTERWVRTSTTPYALAARHLLPQHGLF